jgi:low temperature requirement protein LtrA
VTTPEPEPQPPPDEAIPRSYERVWLDLFYDLVFVAAVFVLSAAFSHADRVGEGLWFAGAFAAIWWIWLATTMHANRFPEDDAVIRILTVAQMFLVAVFAIGAGDGAHAHPEFDAITYGLLTFTVAATFARSARFSADQAPFARRRAIEYTIASAILVVGGVFPDRARIVIWVTGLAVTVVPAIAQNRGAKPLHEHQLLERMGALTIIMCGEAFLKVALAASEDKLDGIDIVVVAFEFVLVFAVWGTYFDDVPHAGARVETGDRSVWIGAHLLLHLGIIGMAIGVSRFVAFHPGQDVPTVDVAADAIPLALMYLALIVISAVSRRRPLGRIAAIRAVAIAAVAIVVAVAAWAPWFDTYWSVAVFAALAIGEMVAENRARNATEVYPVGVLGGGG